MNETLLMCLNMMFDLAKGTEFKWAIELKWATESELKNLGERVDLLAFPPVCLPSQGQSFGGELEGKVAGLLSICCLKYMSHPFWTGWGVTKEGGKFNSDSLKEVQVELFAY